MEENVTVGSMADASGWLVCLDFPDGVSKRKVKRHALDECLQSQSGIGAI